MPTLYVVAGPNGCGKSTLTRTTRFRGVEAIDPDAIARGFSAGSRGEAAREAVLRRRDALAASRTHLVETTLAGAGALRHMRAARTNGFRVVLHYISVDSADLALDRVRTRVAAGGHDVPEPDLRRRLARSLANLPVAIARSDEAYLYDNTDPDRPHREVSILKGETWWTAGRIPHWSAAALAGITPRCA